MWWKLLPLPLNKEGLEANKEAVKYEKIIGESTQDYNFIIKPWGREEIGPFKQHQEIYEWFGGAWFLIKRGSKNE